MPKHAVLSVQSIVIYLVKLLDRINIELLILATAFLKKLSIYQENKDQMAACDVVTRLVKLMAVDNDVLLMAVLRLLHNLSFDAALRDEMVKQGLLPKVSRLRIFYGQASHLADDRLHGRHLHTQYTNFWIAQDQTWFKTVDCSSNVPSWAC